MAAGVAALAAASQASGREATVGMLFAAMAGLYVAGRLAILGLARPDGSDPGRRAIAQWLPILATALVAIILRQPDVAVSVIFSTSVACLSLAIGATTFLVPLNMLPPGRRTWPFVLPAALLPFMAGFRGYLFWWHGVLMLLLGAAILGVWREGPSPADAAVPASEPLESNPDSAPTRSSSHALLILVAIVLAAGAAFLEVRQTRVIAAGSRWLTPGLIAGIILSPLLALPAVMTATTVPQEGGTSGRAITALVGTALLNLSLLLPIAIFVQLGMSSFHGSLPQGASLHDYWGALQATSHALSYPMAVWRIDTVILVALGFLLVPVAGGRWLIGAGTALLLMAGYVVYVLSNIYLAITS